MKHVLDHHEQWLAYVNIKDGEPIAMPGPYHEYDPAKEERRLKRLQEGGASGLDGIQEENGEDESELNRALLSDDDIWDLDDETEEGTE